MSMSGTVLGYQKGKASSHSHHGLPTNQPISGLCICAYLHLSAQVPAVSISRAPLQDTLTSWDISRPTGTGTEKHPHEDIEQHPGKKALESKGSVAQDARSRWSARGRQCLTLTAHRILAAKFPRSRAKVSSTVFITAPNWKRAKCPLMWEYILERIDIQLWHTHTMESY